LSHARKRQPLKWTRRWLIRLHLQQNADDTRHHTQKPSPFLLPFTGVKPKKN